MAKSLQEQLMGSGLVDTKKAKAIKQEQRKHKKALGKKGLDPQELERKERLEQERLQKIEKDRLLNQQRDEQTKAREIQAQIAQLIQSNAVKDEGEQGYQFVDDKKIRKLYVSEKAHQQLASGVLAIAKQDDRYCLIPKLVAEKIRERDADVILVLNERQANVADEDDPYKDYQIPDDLMW